jgi:hypothetical protein
MSILAIRIEHPLDVAVQRSQHTDACMHQKVAAFSGTDQALDGGLPFVELLFGLRQLLDIFGRVLKGDKLATAGEGNRFVERGFQPFAIRRTGPRLPA